MQFGLLIHNINPHNNHRRWGLHESAELPKISDEMLYALIDGQLEQNEAEALYSKIGADETLANQVCVLRSLKDMLQAAYNASFKATGALG